MKRVLTAVVLIPLVLLLVFRAHPALLFVAVGGISYFCVREFVALAEGHGFQPLKPLLFAFVLIPFLLPPLLSTEQTGAWGIAYLSFVTVLFSSPAVFLTGTLSRSNLKEALPDAAVSMLGFLYVGVGLFSVCYLRVQGNYGSLLILWLLVTVWSGDISAYYVGSYFGRHKLAPRISPNKTWEGAVASFAVASGLGSAILLNLNPILSWLLSHHLLSAEELFTGIGAPHAPAFPMWFTLAATAITNVAAQLGDLAESAMKRGANLKDSGTILPGHGGMLDRIDALLFAGPIGMLLFALFDLLTTVPSQ